MRKLLFVLLVFLPLLFSAETMFGQFKLGVLVGYNNSKLTTTIEDVSAGFNSGFHVGAFARIGKKVHLQPEIYYTTQGGVFSSSSNGGWDRTIKISSLDVPVLLGF